MMISMNKKYLLISLVLLMALMSGISTMAFGNDKLEIYMELSSWKYAKDTRTLVASMTANDDSGEIPVVGVSVNICDLYVHVACFNTCLRNCQRSYASNKLSRGK